MFFMTPFDWAAMMMRGASQMLTVQAQMAEALLSVGRRNAAMPMRFPMGLPVTLSAPLPVTSAVPTVLPFVRPASAATMGICGPLRVK